MERVENLEMLLTTLATTLGKFKNKSSEEKRKEWGILVTFVSLLKQRKDLFSSQIVKVLDLNQLAPRQGDVV